MLIIGATPIGNLGDATFRLVSELERVETVLCEDTRVAAKLIHGLKISNRPKLIAVHDHNEKELAEQLAAQAKSEDILLLSDAGMPTVSDPGYAVVQAAIAQDVELTVLPGPSAVLTALALSGLATDRFSFEGFLPRKQGKLLERLQEISKAKQTLIFFESAQRLSETLKQLVSVFGPERQAAIARELTKLHEEVIRGTLGELAAQNKSYKGEICLVVAGYSGTAMSFEEASAQLKQLLAEGMSLRDASNLVAENTGFPRRELYQAGLNRN